MAQTKTIQLLRSQNLYESIQAAKTAMNGTSITEGRKDGEMLLARYNAGTTEQPKIQSLICIWHDATGIQPAGWTFIEDVSNNADSPAALRELINKVITGAGLATGTGAFVPKTSDTIIGSSTSITDAVNDIADYIQTMDLTQVGGTSGDVITAVSQADGKVSATKSSLTDVVMTGYSKTSDTGAIAAADTLEVAVSKLENGIASATVKSTDKTVNISNNDGKDLSVNIDGTTLIKNSSTGVISSDLKIIKETTGLDANIKEQYKLVYGSDTTAIGQPINIYKDSALLSVKLLHATDSLKPTYSKNGDIWTDISSESQTEANLALCYAYENANGVVVVEAVPVGDFLRESEFKDGLQVVGGEVSVLVDPSSESVITQYGATAAANVTAPVLSVSSGGVKVSNIQAAIDAAVAHASADLAVSAQGDNYITAAVDVNDNKKINVQADVQDLTATAGTPGVYDSTTGAQTTAPVAGTLSGVAGSLGDAADIATKVKTYVDGAIAIEGARSDAKNKADLKSAVEALDGSAIATAASGNVYTVLTGVTETDGIISKASEVTLAAVAKTGAAADVTIADSGNLITATNVEGALQEIVGNLNAAKVVANDVINVDTTDNTTKLTVTTGNGLEKNNSTLSVKQGDGITVDSNGVAVNTGSGLEINSMSKAVDIKIDSASAKQGDGTTGMLTVSNNGLKLADTWDCGTF